jgi:hypothetical protein
MAHPDLLEKLRPYGSAMLPTASLKVKTLIAERRKINAAVTDRGLTLMPCTSTYALLYM